MIIIMNELETLPFSKRFLVLSRKKKNKKDRQWLQKAFLIACVIVYYPMRGSCIL